MQRRYTVFWMLQCYYKRIFWFSLQSKRQENDNRQAGVRQGEKGRLVQSIKNSYPVFLVEWIMERVGVKGRGREGMVRGGQMNRNLH